MYTIELSDLERKQLLEIIDVATKTLGLNVAQVALNLAYKLNSAVIEDKEDTPVDVRLDN